MLYRPGQEINITFTIRDETGAHIAGLSWSILFVKDGVAVTAGDEYTSISVTENADEYYELKFTPDIDSTSVYMVTALSDAAIPDLFEDRLEPDFAWLMLEGEQVHDYTDESLPTVTYYMPDGTTVLRKYKLVRTGLTERRDRII